MSKYLKKQYPVKGDRSFFKLKHSKYQGCEAGFDLTDFHSKKQFQKILEQHNLKSGYKRVKTGEDVDGNTRYKYTWSNSKVLLVTKHNPLTGKASVPSYRFAEEKPGRAGYIGIEGKCSAVKALADDIKEMGSYKAFDPSNRQYI